MFKNYIKLTFKVLGRRKFFTFISLFGISFTLTILMIITAFLDNELGAHAPVSDQHKMTFIDRVAMKYMAKDTVYDIDTTYVDGRMTVDTNTNIREWMNRSSVSSASFHMLDQYYRKVPFAENYAFYAESGVFDVFVEQRKLALGGIYTDERYWRVFDFEFLEGGPYDRSAIENQEQVVVISNLTRSDYFGTDEPVLGREIKLENKHYKVVGVIKEVSSSRSFVKSEIYLPYTHLPATRLQDKDLMGPFEAVFVAENAGKVRNIKEEISSIATTIPLPDPEDYNLLEVRSKTYSEAYAQNLIYEEDASKSKRYVLLIIGALLGLFIFLPTLNLINVNVTRILERSSEIGVRKAFGANQTNLLVQFVFENVILTIFGGILGFIIAYILIFIINDSQAMGNVQLVFNPSTFIYGFGITVFFGIVSGLIPAWRMSRLHIIKALKENLS